MLRVACTLSLASILAGCSSDSEALSRSQYLAEVNALCSGGGDTTEIPDRGEAKTIEELENIDARIKEEVHEGLERLRAVEPPPELRDAADEWLSAAEVETRAWGELLDATRPVYSGNPEEPMRRWTAASRRATQLGASECASTTSTGYTIDG